ncbi:MAG: transposase, partial [Solirubrobacterales bacterium]|nr:transposase [Solirubrobacterales bacterium]
ERFDQKCGKQLPPVVKAWRDSWEYVIPFMAFPPDVRRVVYTTNPIEALNPGRGCPTNCVGVSRAVGLRSGS